ncbi:unnamed protein product [Prorocentrum cordatum]|uniref:Pentatricopeptide repeat-containing protein n=1 Tax=Prorocentrum cordatum TaxID=2364126 RepID=A0ABN9X2A0_9DINO|nr:unnamed protein product [Polarella glacialis]
MREAKLEPDVISYSAGISACEKGDEMEPDVISYSAGISACEKGEQWQRWSPTSSATALGSARARRASSGSRALALLSEMREAKLEPDVISYSAGISACEKGEQWQRALALLSEIWSPTSSATALGSARARRASSGSGRLRC